MIELFLPEVELFNEETREFIRCKECTLQLEHSLISVRKWESKWHIPFLNSESLTFEQSVDYIRFMTLNKNVDLTYLGSRLKNKDIEKVTSYIKDKATATFFYDDGKKQTGKKEILTAEVIYGLMIGYGIPIECEKWHLNQLLTQIRVCKNQQSPPQKRSKEDALAEMRRLNAERKAKFNTKG